MKITKIIRTFLLVAILSAGLAFSVDAKIVKGDPQGNNVGVPIDGGLLTVLGAAGVAYAVGRKRKKNKAE